MLSLDVPTEDGNANMYDTIPDTAPTMEDVISDAILLEQLIHRHIHHHHYHYLVDFCSIWVFAIPL